MQTLTNLILKNSYTTSQALDRARILKDYLTYKLFSPEKTPDLSDLTADQAYWLENLDQHSLSDINPNNLHETLKQTLAEIQAIPPLTVMVPFDMPLPEQKELGEKLRTDYGSTFLMEIKVNPSLIAGTALVWKGVYRDYSVHQKVVDNHQQILMLFKEYLK